MRRKGRLPIDFTGTTRDAHSIDQAERRQSHNVVQSQRHNPAAEHGTDDESVDVRFNTKGAEMTAVFLSRQALALPDVRLDKIAIVQSALANGSYRVRASELAAKVIESMDLANKIMED